MYDKPTQEQPWHCQREKKSRPLKNFSSKKDFFLENVIFKGHSLHVDWEDFLVTVGECVKG